jgi:two-component system response regulator AdeR
MTAEDSSRTETQSIVEEGSSPTSSETTVLVVDDDPYTVGLYAGMLEDTYRVLTVTSGKEALDLFDEQTTPTIDIVLLERQMSDISGDEVLVEIRQRRLECRVALVSAIEPDLDIAELEFDAYLVKPIRKQDLHKTVECLRRRVEYISHIQNIYSLNARITALEKTLPEERLATSDEYHNLIAQREELESKSQNLMRTIAERDDPGIYRDVLGSIMPS